jgi:hypothetical protein
MCNYQWQNLPLTEIQIPERFKDSVLAYAQHLDASLSDENSEIAQVQQAIYQQSITYGDKFQEHLLEQYKIYLEMADRVSSRRLQTNGFFITIFSGLLAVITFTFNKDTQLPATLQNVLLLGVSLLGIFLSILWRQAINSSKILNSCKFKVINAIENFLPCPGYYQEWDIAKRKGYLTTTVIENYLAWTFLGFWSIFVVYLIFFQVP